MTNSPTSKTSSEVQIVKIFDETCDVCKALTEQGDVGAVTSRGYALRVVEMNEVAAMPEDDPFRGYIVNYHVDETGMIDLPIYAIIDGPMLQASGVIQNLDELNNLLDSWEKWKRTQPQTANVDASSESASD